MRGFINFIQSDKILLRGTLISLALLLLHVLALSIFYRLLPPYVPVYNQLPWGSERLGSRLELFIPFGISTTLLIMVNNASTIGIPITKIAVASLALERIETTAKRR